MNITEQLENIGWTPLHTRLLAHRIGDGSVNYYGHYNWDNKHMEEFVQLANLLKIKYWGPIISDKYGTKKIIIHKKNFIDYASIFETNHEELVKNKLVLLDTLAKLPKDHRLQALLAFIVDDGSCHSWLLSLFVDPNEQVINKVKNLWNELFPNTLSIQIYITKKGTTVYRLFCNRDGIISLRAEIDAAVRNYGPLANLWWKQKLFEERYKKAVSKRAKDIHDTKIDYANKEDIVLDYVKRNKKIHIKEVKKLLNLSKDRAHLFMSKLVKSNKLFLIDAGNRARYSIEYEDNSFEKRRELVLEYLLRSNKVSNTNCMKLLDLGSASAYKLLKSMKINGDLKQLNEKGKLHYVLA